MNDDYKKGIEVMLITLAEMYGVELTDSKSAVYHAVLGDKLKNTDLKSLVVSLGSNKNIRRFPIPVEILEAAKPTIDHKSAAIELVDKIKKAVSKFGYTNPTAAKEHIGPIGWELVVRNGGWFSVTRSSTLFKGTEYAQIRDSAASLIEQYDKGILHQRNPELAESTKEAIRLGRKWPTTSKDINKVLKSSIKEIK